MPSTLQKLTVQRQERKKGQKLKTHDFSVTLTGVLCADALWDCPRSGREERPIWMTYVGSDAEAAAFTANFRAGRKAHNEIGDVFQLPKKGLYRFHSTRTGAGETATTVYMPTVFHVEPEDPMAESVRFCFAPARWWLEREAAALVDEYGDDAWEVARASLLAAYLDRRSEMPILRDPGFHLVLYRRLVRGKMMHEPWGVSAGRRFWGRGYTLCGLDDPRAIYLRRETFANLLAEVTASYSKGERA